MNTPGILDPLSAQIFKDAFGQALPVFRIIVRFTVCAYVLRTSVKLALTMCRPRRVPRPTRQEIREANARRLALATARRIAEDSPPPFHVCDGCSNCPISKDTGLTEEKCHLFGTASCCIGQHIDEGGVICE